MFSSHLCATTKNSRHVILPKSISRSLKKDYLMSETEWRGIGVQQSRGWVHYMVHRPGKTSIVSCLSYWLHRSHHIHKHQMRYFGCSEYDCVHLYVHLIAILLFSRTTRTTLPPAKYWAVKLAQVLLSVSHVLIARWWTHCSDRKFRDDSGLFIFYSDLQKCADVQRY